MYRDRIYVIVSPRQSVLKLAVQGAVNIEPRDVVAAYAIDRGEVAPDEHLAITLHRNRTNDSTARSVVERAVKRSVRIESHELPTADQHLAIALHRDRKDWEVGPRKSLLKGAVQRAVRIEPRNMVSVHAIDHAEIAPDEHLAVTLQRDRIDPVVGP